MQYWKIVVDKHGVHLEDWEIMSDGKHHLCTKMWFASGDWWEVIRYAPLT